MPKFAITAGRAEFNGVDLTDHVASVEVNQSRPELPTTNLQSVGSERIQGLPSDSFTINFQQNYDAGEVDATFNALYENGTPFTIKIRPKSGAISATNPEYQGTGILLDYTPLSGDVGDLATMSLTIPVNGKITRAVA